jgi:hypothetical protein
LVITIGCDQAKEKTPVVPEAIPATVTYNSIGAIPVPPGYTREPAIAGSFADWLRSVPLKKEKNGLFI